MVTKFDEVYKRLLTGNPNVYPNEVQDMVNYVSFVLQNGLQTNQVQDCLEILKISNLLYNNNTNGFLVLDDDLYDRLVVLMKSYGIQTPIGAPNVVFQNRASNIEDLNKDNQELKQVVSFVDNRNMSYFDTLVSNSTPYRESDFSINRNPQEFVQKRSRNRSHSHNLCGTLDKCKYTLDNDARAEGRYDDNSVMIFERDFLAKHIQQGFVNPNDIHLVVSLKYDGISVENTIVNDTIVSSCSRGDTLNNEASDLTPIFGGMKFERASNLTTDAAGLGVKFEYIITDYNKQRLEYATGKSYVNKRNAVIGLINGLDARQFRDYLTPIPLESDFLGFSTDRMVGFNRLDELAFLNRYFTKGIDLRYAYIHGNYTEVLYQLNNFVKEAEYMRDYLPFAYDGVVVEYIDPMIRYKLGKLNSIPRYAIAIKFNPAVKYSTFRGCTFSVGQSGVIVPMAHFDPVEFFGTIHNKTTLHSLKRFNNLQLKRGEKVKLTLNNDVIVYLHKLPVEQQDMSIRTTPLEQFPENCPSCGQPLYVSDSGDTAYCINFMCPERCIARVTNFLAKMNIKDFSDSTIRALGIRTVGELFRVDLQRAQEILGKVNGQKFIDRIEHLKNYPYPDYRFIGSIGFTNIAIATWKTILENYEFDRLLEMHIDEIQYLKNINGIGPKSVDTIINELPFFIEDLKLIRSICNIQMTPIVTDRKKKPQIVFTGFRDPSVEEKLESMGYEIKNNVTKDTMFLVVPYIGFRSTKVDKVFKMLGEKMGKLKGTAPEIIDYNHIPMGVYPTVIDQSIVEDAILKVTSSET